MRRVRGAVRLVQAVVGAGGEEARVARRERRAEQRRVDCAEDGVGVLHRLRQRGARLRRVHARLRDDGDRSGRHVVGDARDVAVPGEADAAGERGGEIVGVPLERRALRRAARRRVGSTPAAIAPATSPSATTAALEPSPRSRGMRSVNVNDQLSGGRVARERAHAEVRLVDRRRSPRRPRARSRARARRRRRRSRGRGSRSWPGARTWIVMSTAVRILEPVAGDRRRRRARPARREPALEPRDAGGRRGLAEHALPRGRAARQARKDLVVVDGDDRAARPLERVLDLVAVDRLDDADRRRDGVGALRRLDRVQARQRAGRLEEAARVRLRVAAAAVRERQHVGHAAELLEDLERSGLLALDAVRDSSS